MEHSLGDNYGNVELKPLVSDDIEKLRSWRNNKYETKYLRNVGHITREI